MFRGFELCEHRFNTEIGSIVQDGWCHALIGMASLYDFIPRAPADSIDDVKDDEWLMDQPVACAMGLR
jgi:hypothetical protein